MIKTILIAAAVIFPTASQAAKWTMQPKYEPRIILLDAEELAELGIKKTAMEIIANNKTKLHDNIVIEEQIDPDAPSYSVVFNKKKYKIFAPGFNAEEGEAWSIATTTLFNIINSVRRNSDFTFYAIYGGNDLMGIFLTPSEYSDIIKSTNKIDRPYIPK